MLFFAKLDCYAVAVSVNAVVTAFDLGKLKLSVNIEGLDVASDGKGCAVFNSVVEIML